MVMVKEELRKGPWTEQEDLQLVCFVGLFGERRWDFIAKVSGLNRTGKSCRLRWVNYLQPGLKRGRITPQEERLILDLHSRWGNRWSRIARKLPGRTDNEIKNYWRTHMRKKAQEQKKKIASITPSASASSSYSSSSSSSSPSSSSWSSGCSSSSITNNQILCRSPIPAEPLSEAASTDESRSELMMIEEHSMDQIWNEIAAPEEEEEAVAIGELPCPPMMTWDNYCSDSLWKVDDYEEELMMLLPMIDHSSSLLMK